MLQWFTFPTLFSSPRLSMAAGRSPPWLTPLVPHSAENQQATGGNSSSRLFSQDLFNPLDNLCRLVHNLCCERLQLFACGGFNFQPSFLGLGQKLGITHGFSMGFS